MLRFACRKSLFFKKVLILNPYPLPRGEGLCMLGWLCVLAKPLAYTPGIRAGAECGATAPDQARMLAVSHTKPLHDAVAQMADDLYGGGSPKARTLWLLAKSFARCKTHKASNARHPIFINDIGFSTDRNGAYQEDMLRYFFIRII